MKGSQVRAGGPEVAARAFPLTLACWGRCVGWLLRQRPSDTAAAAAAATAIVPARELLEKFIVARYTEPQRHYHTMAHLEEMLGCFERFQSEAPVAHRLPAADPRRVVLELAILFHDAVYDPRRDDNEECSAAWFQAFWVDAQRMATATAAQASPLASAEARGSAAPLLWDDPGLAREVEEEVVRFILQTKHHISLEPDHTHRAPESGDPPPPPLHIFLDLDLAILGNAAVRYQQYALDIRREYGWHSEADFCRGRAAFLRGLLQHPKWYKTKFFCDALEARARANVAAEVATLEARLRHLPPPHEQP
ncbi:uncharacterized protein Tco025E_08391 [Trypanosoma conorhini]|uniref:Hd phosphohydrolase family protein n=1 Tax=Trypanosoma conorhini TaxID=83891 RepID=A0A3R7MH21_9TRYP|nr:uncharacterized protein Tco025E_08391 [Trypanosoma conorhini]RNF02378.1 hypothetical protein Tco025E_08391 [Trypanosoma conorhini]